MDHPIDAAVRAKLRELSPNQQALADVIGRSQGWLNKYMHGDGNATLDDIVRIAAAFVGVNVQPLTELERRLLKAFRAVRGERREDAVTVFENISKGKLYRPEQPQESTEPTVHTPPATSRKGRGKRKAGVG
jgi:transcriptional regulator with XRE-family HTH domain